MTYSISFTPTQQHLDEIEKWLIEEQSATGDGFYCNWTIIKSFFKKNNFAVISSNNLPIGFACWRHTSTLSGQINIFEIKPDFRKQGAGTYFTDKLLDFLIAQNIYVVDLQCVPPESESFWRKFDFIDVPSNIRFWDFRTQHLFRRLISHKQPTENYEGENYIEIWDAEPYATKNKESKWKWEIEINAENKTLKLPIIHPCEKDWRIRLIQKGKAVIDDKIKRFGSLEIDYGPYVIITELP